MTVIDRAHRTVLILLVTTIPAIFLVDFVAEVLRGDITFSPGWQVYVALVAIAARQIVKRQWEADWIIVGGGLGTAAMGLISFYLSPTVIDLTAAIVLLPVVGLVAVAVSRRAPTVTGAVLGVAAVVLSTIAFIDEGLAIDDVITKAAAVAILFGLGGWLLYQLRRGYEEQYAARDRFVATVSHELRTPLTALAGFSEVLADGQADDDIVGLIRDQAFEAVNIVEDLLVAARTNAGQVAVTVAPTDIAAEVSTVLDGISNALGTKSVGNRVERILVAADPLRLRQIVRNLVTNAIRHGGESIWLRSSESDGFAVIEVCDNGPGFDMNEAESLFAAYGRARLTNLGTGSIGLGLTVSRELARLMGGELSASSTEGLTVFALSLPLAVADLSPARP